MQKIFGHETRLEGGQLTRDVIFHPSMKISPTYIKDPTYMITMVSLHQAWGPLWQPQYCELNEYEKYCKEYWGKYLVSWSQCVLVVLLIWLNHFSVLAHRTNQALLQYSNRLRICLTRAAWTDNIRR